MKASSHRSIFSCRRMAIVGTLCALVFSFCIYLLSSADYFPDWLRSSLSENNSNALVAADPAPARPLDSMSRLIASNDARIKSDSASAERAAIALGNDSPSTKVPVYRSSDFLKGYLDNRVYPIIVEGKPWNNGPTNVAQYQEKGGGTSFWDFWPDEEDWESTNHMWQDDEGKWQGYKTESIEDANGKETTAYILVDRRGPGVLDKLWFTNDATRSFLGLLDQLNLSGRRDPPELTQWGNLSRLGKLRIEVDENIVFDGPIKKWFSGEAQNLPDTLKKIFVWKYQDFGSNGNIIPIPYQERIKISVYGGLAKPKWFMATGVTLPEGSRVKSYSGKIDDLPLEELARSAQNALKPEEYIHSFSNIQNFEINAQPVSSAAIQIAGSGTVEAMQFTIAKRDDPKRLWLKVKYGEDDAPALSFARQTAPNDKASAGASLGISLPFLAFFSEPDQLSLHRSTPIGLIESGDAYLFYSNFPLPYQNGISIEISSVLGAVPVHARVATSDAIYNTQLRVLFKESEKLQIYGPDYAVDLKGDGKLVGLVLVTKDQDFDKIPKVYLPNKSPRQEDPATKTWPLGYLEGNLLLYDGTGSTRLYSGHEDWADGGFYFNSGYTAPAGGSNRPFGGILRYDGSKDGYATLFRYFNDLSAFRFRDGLHLSFGHGTWRNNFPVRYGVTLYYYQEIKNIPTVLLPASEYVLEQRILASAMPQSKSAKASEDDDTFFLKAQRFIKSIISITPTPRESRDTGVGDGS